MQEHTLNIIYITDVLGNSQPYQGFCAQDPMSDAPASLSACRKTWGSSCCTAELQTAMAGQSQNLKENTGLKGHTQPHTLHLACSVYFKQKTMGYQPSNHLLTGSQMELIFTVPILEPSYEICSWFSKCCEYIASNPVFFPLIQKFSSSANYEWTKYTFICLLFNTDHIPELQNEILFYAEDMPTHLI